MIFNVSNNHRLVTTKPEKRCIYKGFRVFCFSMEHAVIGLYAKNLQKAVGQFAVKALFRNGFKALAFCKVPAKNHPARSSCIFFPASLIFSGWA